MRRVAPALLLLCMLGLQATAFPAVAQAAPSIVGLQVSLWPEYDARSMLVIYRVHLASETELPTVVEVPIPASVGDPLAVAMTDASGTLVNAQYTRTVSGEWGLISVTGDSLQLQIEYYTPLVFDGQLRRFTYTWPGAPGVQDISYEVQAPIGADQMTITPAPQSQSVGQDGLTYYVADLGADAAASGSEIDITYVKTSADLTADLLGAAPGSSDATQGGTPDLRQYIPWILLAFGLILLAVGGVWYLRLARAGPAAGSRRRRRPSRQASRPGRGLEEMDASPIYCHNCGTRAAASDRFCRNCGVRLRR
jgi:hypothetical protein